MKQGKILGILLLVFLVGCNPFARKKSNTPKEDLSEYMSSTPLAEVERSGSFTAEDNDALQEKLLERFKETQCTKEWMGFLQRKRYGVIVSQMRPSLDSKERIVNSDGSESYFLPTTIVGYWLELRKFRSRPNLYGRVEIREYTPVRKSPSLMYQKIHRWRARGKCKRIPLIARKMKIFPYTKGAKLFNDKKLRTLIKKGAGLIYLWSPNMPYSTASIRSKKENWGLDTLIDIAKEKGLEITYLLDPQANVPAALRAAKIVRKKVPRLKDIRVTRGTSIELYMRMTGLHFPTLLYFKDGKIARTHLPGIAGEKQIRTYIDEQEKHLSGLSFRSRYSGRTE